MLYLFDSISYYTGEERVELFMDFCRYIINTNNIVYYYTVNIAPNVRYFIRFDCLKFSEFAIVCLVDAAALEYFITNLFYGMLLGIQCV